MTDLSPRARALIESAMEHEELPSPAELRKVRRAIMTGVAAGAAVSAVSTTSFFAKAAAMTGGLAGQMTAYAVAGAIAASATIAVHERFVEEAPNRALIVPSAPAKTGERGVRDFRSGSATPTTAMATALAEPEATPPDTPNEASRGSESSNSAEVPVGPPIEVPARSAQNGVLPADGAPSSVVPRAGGSLGAGASSATPARAQRSTDENIAPRGAAATNPVTSNAPAAPDAIATEGARSPSNALAHQLAYLHAMRAELRAGNAERALAMSRESEALFAGSAMYAESRAAHIAALCRLGRIAEARHEISKFRQRFPSSALLSTVEDSCASDSAGGQ
jgi:hypothetical protein